MGGDISDQYRVKRCPKCGNTKSYEDFHKRTDSANGRAPGCKSCASEYNRNKRIAAILADPVGVYAKEKEKCLMRRSKISRHNKNRYKTDIAYRSRLLFGAKVLRKNCNDAYVNSLLNNRFKGKNRILFNDIPPEIIEQKRLLILINREIKKQ